MSYKDISPGKFTDFIITIVQNTSFSDYHKQHNIYDNLDKLGKYVVCDIEDLLMLDRIINDSKATDN